MIAYVHQLTIFMIVPIFNSMARIDKRTIEAARDAGASRGSRSMRLIVLPLSQDRHCARLDLRGLDRDGRLLRREGDVRRRLGLGGRRLLRGHRRAAVSAGRGQRRRSSPRGLAAMVALILRTVDVRKEIDAVTATRRAHMPTMAGPRAARGRRRAGRPSLDVLRAGDAVRPVRPRALRTDGLHLHPVVPGCPRRPGVSDEGTVAALVRRSLHPGAHRRRQGRVRAARSGWPWWSP